MGLSRIAAVRGPRRGIQQRLAALKIGVARHDLTVWQMHKQHRALKVRAHATDRSKNRGQRLAARAADIGQDV